MQVKVFRDEKVAKLMASAIKRNGTYYQLCVSSFCNVTREQHNKFFLHKGEAKRTAARLKNANNVGAIYVIQHDNQGHHIILKLYSTHTEKYL